MMRELKRKRERERGNLNVKRKDLSIFSLGFTLNIVTEYKWENFKRFDSV